MPNIEYKDVPEIPLTHATDCWWRAGRKGEIRWRGSRWVADDRHLVWESEDRKIELLVCVPRKAERPSLWGFCFFFESFVKENNKWQPETFFPIPVVMVDIFADWLGIASSLLIQRLRKETHDASASES